MMTDTPEKKALRYFSSDYNCAQSVFLALLEHKGLPLDRAAQIAAGFGGGITHSGQQCGALSGAMMAIGVLEGVETSDVKQHKATTYRLSAELLERFKEVFETIRCDDLTGVDMSDQEALERASKEGVFSKVCPGYVEKAVRIVMDLFPDH
jgi:C_GCAxxG_C_C family probable redox protein